MQLKTFHTLLGTLNSLQAHLLIYYKNLIHYVQFHTPYKLLELIDKIY